MHVTIDQGIALAASVGACLSALATFWTVRKMSQQREATYLPEIVLARTIFSGSKNPLVKGELPTLWVPKTDAAGMPETALTFSMPLLNVGLGAAKNISVSWSFPIGDMVDRVNELARRAHIPGTVELKEGTLSITSDALGTQTSMWENQRQEWIDFALPAVIQKDPITIRVPPAFITLSSAILFLAAKDGGLQKIANIPPINVDMKFQDIGDRHHVAAFSITLTIIALAGSGTGFHGYLDPRKPR